MSWRKKPLIFVHHDRCEAYEKLGHPESPARVRETVQLMKKTFRDAEWEKPTQISDKALLLSHTPVHLAGLRSGRDFDEDTPAYRDIDLHARYAAGGALNACELALNGNAAFSLLRPPGHHAMRERAMGFCYLNSAAAAALTVARNGHRVAIWDFDAHHGNGTEDMVMGAMRVQFASVHQFPGYPGTGEVSSGNCFNYPVAPYTPPEEHLEICRQSLQKLLQEHPQLLVVSAGFDAYHGDPLTQMSLRVEDFYTLGTWVKDCGIPAAAVLEGGYSPELPQLVEAFVKGWRGL